MDLKNTIRFMTLARYAYENVTIYDQKQIINTHINLIVFGKNLENTFFKGFFQG